MEGSFREKEEGDGVEELKGRARKARSCSQSRGRETQGGTGEEGSCGCIEKSKT